MSLTFGEKIKTARKNKNLTQKQLAYKIGSKHNSVSDWENDKNKPDPDTIELLCGVLDLSPNYLLGNKENEDFFSPFEKDFIKKYRLISEKDADGKALVNTTVEYLYGRIQILENTRQQLRERTSHVIELERTTRPRYPINYYQRLASAGSGEYLFDSVPTDIINVPASSISEQADFVIGVNGHSMEPTYHDGDKVYVKIADKIPAGHIGVFTRGNECLIKELGTTCLKSHNYAGGYEDIPRNEEEIRLVGEVLGKVEED